MTNVMAQMYYRPTLLTMKQKSGCRIRVVAISSYVEPELYERARVAAFEEHCSLSDIVRQALIQYLKKPEGGRPGGGASQEFKGLSR